MKVAILSAGVPSQRYPLNGVFAFDQAKALADAGLEVFFLSVDFRSIKKIRRWGFTHGEENGVKWYNYSIPIGPFSSILNVLDKPVIRYLYKKAFRKDRPDIIHAHFTGMGTLANELKTRYGVPYVITEHSSTMNKLIIPESLQKTAETSYRNASRVLAVSSLLAKSIKNKTGIEAFVVPNIIDTSIFKLKETKEHQGLRLVTTALLSERKRIHLLLHAIDELKEQYQDITLDVIGDGEEKKKLQQYVEGHSLESVITFHGMLSREEAGKIYQQSDCFVLSSALETFGVVYVEAMAAGLPVIATRCGGPEDFVDDNNGILVDVDNVTQLKDAIVYMYNHYKEYNNAVIKETVSDRFSPGVIAGQIESIYKEVLEKQ